MPRRVWFTIPKGPEYEPVRAIARNPKALLYLARRGAEAELHNVTGQVIIPANRLIRYSVSKSNDEYLSLLDRGGRWMDISKALASRLGYDLVELLGRYPYELMDERSARFGQAVIEGQPLPDDDRVRVFISKTGERVKIQKLVSFEIDIKGIPARSLVVWQEIS